MILFTVTCLVRTVGTKRLFGRAWRRRRSQALPRL